MKLKRSLTSFPTWVTISTIVVLIVGGGLICAAYDGWDVGTGDHDKGMTVTLAATIAAAVLGAVAAVLALFAYLAASGRPDLGVEVRFPYCEPNKAVFKVGPPSEQNGWIPLIEPIKQGLAQVELYNRSPYSARNPGVRIQLFGISIARRYGEGITLTRLKPDHIMNGWSPLNHLNMIGPTVYQWEGGADQIVHGNWSRTLPEFDLRGAYIIAGASVMMLRITIVADGVKPIHQDIPLKQLDVAQWNQWVVDRTMTVETGAVVLRELATEAMEPHPTGESEAAS